MWWAYTSAEHTRKKGTPRRVSGDLSGIRKFTFFLGSLPESITTCEGSLLRVVVKSLVKEVSWTLNTLSVSVAVQQRLWKSQGDWSFAELEKKWRFYSNLTRLTLLLLLLPQMKTKYRLFCVFFFFFFGGILLFCRICTSSRFPSSCSQLCMLRATHNLRLKLPSTQIF